MKNQRMINIALGIEPPDKYHNLSFARITANNQQYFKLRVLVGDKPVEEVVQGSPCGTFLARGKVRMRMAKGDVVLVEGLEGLPAALAREKKLTVEITARLSKKQAQQAYRAGLLPKAIYKEPGDDDEDLFDYDSDYSDGEGEGDEDDEGDVTVKKKFGKTQKVKKAPTAGTSGRGSGGKKDYGGTGGGGGGAKTSTAGHKVVKDQLDALRYASGAAAAELAADVEPDDSFDFDLAEGLGLKKAAAAPAAEATNADKETGTKFSLFSAGAAAARDAYEDFGGGGGAASAARNAYEDFRPLRQKKVRNSWEDEDSDAEDELDIDAI
jgi:hypothetical protein